MNQTHELQVCRRIQPNYLYNFSISNKPTQNNVFYLLVCVNCSSMQDALLAESGLHRSNRRLVQGKSLGQITSTILYFKTSCVVAAFVQMGDHQCHIGIW